MHLLLLLEPLLGVHQLRTQDISISQLLSAHLEFMTHMRKSTLTDGSDDGELFKNIKCLAKATLMNIGRMDVCASRLTGPAPGCENQ